MSIPMTALLAALAVPALVVPALAQDEDPRQILHASAMAVREVEGFGAQFRLSGEGSEMIRSTMPSMSGRLIFGRTQDGAVMRALGESRDSATGPATAFDVLRTAETLVWTDDARQTVFVRRAQPEPREMPSPARLMHLTNLLAEDAYAGMLERAESISHEGVKQAGGEACDVILVSFPKPGPGRAGPGHSAERWFIAQSDRLPRRHEQITDAGLVKYSLVTDLSGLRVGAQAAGDLDVRRPENYRVDDSTVARERVAPAPTPETRPDTTPAQPVVTEPTPALPVARMAPAFSFTPDGGTKVDNATQSGRVTVLYFWGTWCIPCRAVSPRVSELAKSFADRPVDVFAPAIRERDPEAPRAYLAEQGFAHRLVLGVDSLAQSFRVRVYPTIVVIGPDGTIAYEGHPGPNRTPEALGDEVRAAVEKLLNQG